MWKVQGKHDEDTISGSRVNYVQRLSSNESETLSGYLDTQAQKLL